MRKIEEIMILTNIDREFPLMPERGDLRPLIIKDTVAFQSTKLEWGSTIFDLKITMNQFLETLDFTDKPKKFKITIEELD